MEKVHGKAFARRWRGILLVLMAILTISILPVDGRAAEYSEVRSLFFSGDYDQCIEMSVAEVERGVWNENWPTLLLQCRLVKGQYEQAVADYEAAIERFSRSIGLRMIGHEVYNFAGQSRTADRMHNEIIALVQENAWRYSSSKDRVVLGRFLVEKGEDARDILELFYDRAKRSNAQYAEVYIATAELALEKHDYQEAAKALEEAVELEPANPQIQYLLALAWQNDTEKVNDFIHRALELNPRHVPSLLFQVDNLIDGEAYAAAEEVLERVFAVNPHEPKGWAYRAVIAHLRGQTRKESEYRWKALAHWKENPHVDHLIGKKLSRNYRFAEGAEYQRRALKWKPDMLAAKFQLSQDLLRLGDEENGWKLAAQVHDADGYNVVAYNTLTLKAELDKFDTIESDHFLIRMDGREARIYGQQALTLLEEAHDKFTEKYDVQLEYPTIVEIFPQQKDFAIRTFGLPGGAGFLGVCFGRVVTANSPASQGAVPANWQSVLWHEFCHVVTLTKTKNKMPRWLSEGISTYEEQQRNDSWGERMSPTYQRMIAGDDLTPVSELSAAFLSPKSPVHLQFAYYESSLVVRYLIDTYGLDTLKRILTDLSVGMPINESLQRYTGSLKALDDDFAKHAREYAMQQAPEADWSWSEEWNQVSPPEFPALLDEHPHNYGLLQRKAAGLLRAEQYEQAESTLLEIRRLYPNDRGESGCLAMLASLYQKTKQAEKELEVLTEYVRLNDRALSAYQRIAELHLQAERWEAARRNALRYLAVQPLQPIGHILLTQAAKKLDRPADIAASQHALLEMDPVDPAATHFQLAQALQASGEYSRAKRQVLMALEQAPRYRAAQQFLLDLRERETSTQKESEAK